MQGVAVTLLTEDRERLSVLQSRLEGTGMGRNVFSHVGFPTSPTDPVLRQMQDGQDSAFLFAFRVMRDQLFYFCELFLRQ